MDALNQIMKNERAGSLEGKRGVEFLAKLCRRLGYKDSTYFGQFAPDGCYGDLIEFFEDNCGAIEAVLEWIVEQYPTELNEIAGFVHQYAVTECPSCQADLCQLGSVKVQGHSSSGQLLGFGITHLDSEGNLLPDSEDYLENGEHSSSMCISCGQILDNYEV